MIYLSASLIKDFLVCPKKAYYRIGAPGESIQTPEALRGTIVHKVLEDAWSSKKKAYQSIKKLQDEHNFFKEEKNIYTCVDNFFEMFNGVLSPTDQIEKFFRYQHKDDIYFSGKIDRIHNGVVFDWKTGEGKPFDINKDIQFIMYYLAYKQLFKKEPSSVTYVSLFNKTMHRYTPDKKYIDEFLYEIVPYVAKQLKDKDLPRIGLYGFNLCKKCFYKEICFRELENE